MAHKTYEFEKLVQEMMKEWNVPGLSIAIVQGDEIYAKVFVRHSSMAHVTHML
jgi:CubicO group peptidase (beta-lactamase class C family)